MIRRAGERPRYLFALDCGTGKTIGMLATIQAYPMRTLVIAPKSVALTAWTNDAANFPSLRVVIVRAEDSDREAKIGSEWDVLVTNYEMFKKYASWFLNHGVKRLVVDESSKLKAPDTAITKKAIEFSDRMDSVYLLSGTPAPNSWTEYWGQVRCIKGPSLEPYFAWCHKCGYPVRMQIRQNGQEKSVIKRWDQSPAQKEAFQRAMAQYSWPLSKADCLDLPSQLDRVIDVRLSDPEARAYTSAVYELRVKLRGDRIGHIKGAAALTKLRQIVGGAVYFDGESHDFDGCAKLDALGEILDEIGPAPVVIWFEFRHERERIAEYIGTERGEHCEWLDGETSNQAEFIVKRFQEGLTPRLLCHPQAAGHGVTLHKASHAVYYSLNFSYEQWKQSRDRIHRAGMGDAPATYHVLRATLGDERTVDHAMLRTIRDKGRESDGILEALKDIGVGVAQEEAA